jgi:hypothetical protein
MSLRAPSDYTVLEAAENILNIERYAFESSLFSLFNKRDHADLIKRITYNKDVLQNVANNLENKKISEKTNEDKYLQQFSLCLIRLAEMIILVCSGLDLKTKGLPYSHQQYKSGLTLIEMEKMKCLRASELCNLHEKWLKLIKN